jgi:hypothetical protein
MMSEHYFNTNEESGEELAKSNEKAAQQEWAVTALFNACAPEGRTPCEAHTELGGDTYALQTSIRRAITNLSTAGVLEKTGELRRGKHGKQVHVWRLRALEPSVELPATWKELAQWASSELAGHHGTAELWDSVESCAEDIDGLILRIVHAIETRRLPKE